MNEKNIFISFLLFTSVYVYADWGMAGRLKESNAKVEVPCSNATKARYAMYAQSRK
jgi:hypothetical protein